MRAFLTDCRYRSTIELKEADNGRPDATGENQSLFMKTPKKGSRASTQIPPPMFPSPKCNPTIKPSIISSMPTISPKSKKGPPQDFKLSTLNKIHLLILIDSTSAEHRRHPRASSKEREQSRRLQTDEFEHGQIPPEIGRDEGQRLRDVGVIILGIQEKTKNLRKSYSRGVRKIERHC